MYRGINIRKKALIILDSVYEKIHKMFGSKFLIQIIYCFFGLSFFKTLTHFPHWPQIQVTIKSKF